MEIAMNDQEETKQSVELTESDVFFTCPFCTKSLVIDEEARGLEITCPDCGKDIIVPGARPAGSPERQASTRQLTDSQRIESLSHALQASHEDVRRLTTHLSEVGNRRKFLEKLRADHIRRLERVAEELRVTQSAIDRIAEILRESADEQDV